jgi:ribosomal protein S6
MKPFIYETMYILRPDLGEEMTDQAIAKYQTILRDQGAENIETQHRGKRRLAYEIGKHRDGVYVQMNYTAPGAGDSSFIDPTCPDKIAPIRVEVGSPEAFGFKTQVPVCPTVLKANFRMLSAAFQSLSKTNPHPQA